MLYLSVDLKNFLLVFIIFSLISSCAFHSGMVSSSSFEKPKQYVDIAVGSSITSKILGLGGLSKDALVLQAKKDMMLNRPLAKNEMYANYTTNFKHTFVLFIYQETKVVVSADVVIDFQDSSMNRESNTYSNKLLVNTRTYEIEIDNIENETFSNNTDTNLNTKASFFSIGDTVLDKKNRLCVIKDTSVSFDNSLLVSYINDDKNDKEFSIYQLFSNTKKRYGYIPGVSTIDSEVLGSRKVVGVGINKVLLVNSEGQAVTVRYKHLDF